MAIRINLGTLKEGEQHLELEIDAKELEIDQKLIKNNVLLSMDIYKTSNQLDLRINIKGTMLLECDRCLEVFEKPMDIKHELVIVQKSVREEKLDVSQMDDYLKYYSTHMKSVDITNDIREFILLAVPMRRVPDMKDDKCAWCGRTEEYFNKYFRKKED